MRLDVGRLLSIQNLQVDYTVRNGTVRAVDGVSFDVNKEETVALAGESGCGKSMTALAVMRMLGTQGRAAVSGKIMLDNIDLLRLGHQEMQEIWGRKMFIIFQDPMSSLNPVRKFWFERKRDDWHEARLFFHAGPQS